MGFYPYCYNNLWLYCSLERTCATNEKRSSLNKIAEAQVDKSTITVLEKLDDDLAILLAMLFDFDVLGHALSRENRPMTDEITHGVQGAIITQRITVSLLFALQVCLDIFHKLSPNTTQGHQKLQATADYTRKCAENAWKCVDHLTDQPHQDS
jgi:hypothetical protein